MHCVLTRINQPSFRRNAASGQEPASAAGGAGSQARTPSLAADAGRRVAAAPPRGGGARGGPPTTPGGGDGGASAATAGGGDGALAAASAGSIDGATASAAAAPPVITIAALAYSRHTTAKMFLRAAGYKPVNDKLLASALIMRVRAEGCQFFVDSSRRYCVAYNCYSEADVRAAELVAGGGGQPATMERYLGPSFPHSDFSKCVANGHVRIHRPLVAIFRAALQ
jgi:hypothetical protein